ncbi:MAG: hypothetical protein AABW80_05170 [Nanoarchaeota archaeon]
MINGLIFDWETGLRAHYETDREQVEETLLTLGIKRYKLGLIAEGVDVSCFSKMLRTSRLGGYFDTVVLSRSKMLENYRNCIESMKTTPQSTLFIGNTEQCTRAKSFGIQTFVSNGKLIVPDLENLTSLSLEEIMLVS